MPSLPAQSACRSTFWLAFWLAAGLVLIKALYLLRPETPPPWKPNYVGELAIAAHADILYAVLVGLAGQGLLYLAGDRPRLRRTLWTLVAAVCLVSIGYGIIGMHTFRNQGAPLTYHLMYMAGDIKNMRSSIMRYVTVGSVSGLAAALALYLAAVWASPRLLRIEPGRGHPWMPAILLAAVVVYAAVAHHAEAGLFKNRGDRRVAQNFHWALIWSLLSEWKGGPAVHLNDQFPPGDLEDFESASHRPAPDWPLPASPPPKNLILVVLESVSTQHLGLYGSPYPTTPHLEAEARHALVFDNFYAQVGNSANSLVALTLSVYPGLSWRQLSEEKPDLPGTTLAQLLHPRGYRTLFITSGDNHYAGQGRFLANRGFDQILDHRDLDCPMLFSWGVEDRCMMDGLMSWIDKAPQRPFFAIAWTQQTHHPYGLRPNQTPVNFFRGKPLPEDDWDLGQYLNAMRETDRQIARLFAFLRQRGLADDTLVVLTGDHGEAFHDPHPTYGHGSKLWEENIHVPLIMWNPRLWPVGRRVATIGAHVDLNPTLLELMGRPVPCPESWQGYSLFDPKRPQRAYSYAVKDDYLLSVRDGSWKYIFNLDLATQQLFDLSQDPREQHDLSADHPDVCTRLRQRLSAWVNTENARMSQILAGG